MFGCVGYVSACMCVGACNMHVCTCVCGRIIHTYVCMYVCTCVCVCVCVCAKSDNTYTNWKYYAYLQGKLSVHSSLCFQKSTMLPTQAEMLRGKQKAGPYTCAVPGHRLSMSSLR